MAKSSKSRPKGKSKKPYPEFPLTAHQSNQWCKKHKGKQFYFGPLADWQGALERYKSDWPHILADRTPPPVATGDFCSIQLLCNLFLTSKRNSMDAGEVAPRTFQDYYEACEMLVDEFGRDRPVDDLRSDDFARLRATMSNRWGPVRLKNTMTRVRMVFKFALDERLIKQTVLYGQSFAPPSAKMLRQSRNEAGPRMFEADELRRILDAAAQPVKAMTLLGLNCGFGNTDVATLPQSAVDLDNGWIDFPRPKTAIPRRIPIWRETVVALRESLTIRPKPKDDAHNGLCFVTRSGTPWVRSTQSPAGRYMRRDQVGTRFGLLLKDLGIDGRYRIGFYTIRHVFETIAGESRDQVAVDAIMGHVDNSMAAAYRERISDDRLRAVVGVVREWLWPEAAKTSDDGQ